MTNDQINRLIAIELGWKPYRHRRSDLWSLVDTKDNIVGRASHGGISEDHCWAVCNLDFCEDHNAVALMRNALKPEEQRLFTQHLLAVVNPGGPVALMWNLWKTLNATPLQQCKSFLRLRGKWAAQ